MGSKIRRQSAVKRFTMCSGTFWPSWQSNSSITKWGVRRRRVMAATVPGEAAGTHRKME